jgi:beta-barrel assembly-enhancing protease
VAGHPAAGRPLCGRLPGAAALSAALALVLSGCISEEREVVLGDQIAAQINVQLPLVRDAEVNRYLTALGRGIAAHSERPHLEYHFYIVDSPTLNAFALPGGHVYVHRGLVERTRNASELAGVLAHEIGHVAARHGAQNLQRQLRTRSMAATMYHLILDRGPLLDREALDLGGALWNASHSRRAEVEADRLAVRYLLQSGVDPRGMLSLFSVLWEEEQQAGAPEQGSWFSTHPGTMRRMEATRGKIREQLPRYGADGLAVDEEAFPRFLARLQALPSTGMLPLLLPPGHPAHPAQGGDE